MIFAVVETPFRASLLRFGLSLHGVSPICGGGCTMSPPPELRRTMSPELRLRLAGGYPYSTRFGVVGEVGG
jgi:hypothetical protein